MNENEQLYYLQAGYVGNAILWWGQNHCGYTTDLAKAGKYTKAQCKQVTRLAGRTERAWPVEYVDKHLQAKIVVVDSQYLDVKKSRRWPHEAAERRKLNRPAPKGDPDKYDVFDCSAT